jgi:hypothetical protein
VQLSCFTASALSKICDVLSQNNLTNFSNSKLLIVADFISLCKPFSDSARDAIPFLQ